MARRIAARSQTPSLRVAEDTTKSQLEKTLGYLTAYIPTAVVTGFVPVWSAVVASELPASPDQAGVAVSFQVKLAIAIITALLGGGITWALAQATARKLAKDANTTPPTAGTTFRSGLFDIGAATLAAFTWATVAPSNWAGIDQQFAILGIAVTVGGVLTIAAALRGDD
jgi:hypothetical protein